MLAAMEARGQSEHIDDDKQQVQVVTLWEVICTGTAAQVVNFNKVVAQSGSQHAASHSSLPAHRIASSAMASSSSSQVAPAEVPLVASFSPPVEVCTKSCPWWPCRAVVDAGGTHYVVAVASVEEEEHVGHAHPACRGHSLLSHMAMVTSEP